MTTRYPEDEDMADRDDTAPRDPAAKKARDNARQRKIATNSSDKASRRNAPRIKAAANRKIRRADKQAIDPELEASADQINLEHQRKLKHWGSDNAAEHREASARSQRDLQDIGGRDEANRQIWEEMRDKTDNKVVIQHYDDALARLKAKKPTP